MAQSVYYAADDQRLDSRHVKEIYLFFCTSKPTIGPTKPPTEWDRSSFPVVKRLDSETGRSPLSGAKPKKCSYTTTSSTSVGRGNVGTFVA